MMTLHNGGYGIKPIADILGCSAHTVRRYVKAGGPVPIAKVQRRRKLDGYDDWLAERFRRHRGNVVVIHKEFCSETAEVVSLRTLQRALRPHRLAKQAELQGTYGRFETPPGREVQIDFCRTRVEIGGRQVSASLFVAVLGYSRLLHVRAYRDERQSHWLDGLKSAFVVFRGVPAEVLMDNARSLVIHHNTRRGVVFTDELMAFSRQWGFTPRACAPYRPCTKGKVERAVAYVKNNAIAGRRFASWDEFEVHLARWECEVANRRKHGTIKEAPIERFLRDEVHSLKPLHGRPSFKPARQPTRNVGRSCATKIASNGRSASDKGTGSVKNSPSRRASCRIEA